MTVAARLAQLGLELPRAPQALGRYRATTIAHGLLFISGQLPSVAGNLRYRGRVGAELSVTEGIEAARLAALNVLAQIDAALGGFDSLETLVWVEGHISSAAGFVFQPTVLDGASELFNYVLEEKAGHARAVFAPEKLPLNATIELIVTAAIRR